ncbi:hypothetical protein EDB85DRAFT_2150501 [Lactarius pseudohatsudake]|nr:hypothetical protein EDB85DRAFT_2150501 [Lactarius pseudohatsudake]
MPPALSPLSATKHVGSNLSPGKLGDDLSSPVHKFSGVQPLHATDEGDNEEDVMGTFENTSDDNFVPGVPSKPGLLVDPD